MSPKPKKPTASAPRGKKKVPADLPTEAWSAARIRKLWMDFFRSKKHMVLPSASLLPSGDPTLLFNTAGMVPFKAYFAGTEKPPSPRVATIQKCLRTTDLESVGKTERHCTFFEMLGNFSFGDYFKRESIQWAYEFSLKHLNLDPEKIYITVYQDDDEAEEIWHKEVGVPMNRIRRLGKDANWWGPAGDSGACGPCSELYLDRGEERCNRKPDASCGPGCSCDRFMEYWNLVFNQFHQDTSGKLHPLPMTGIDTGAGLERITMLKLEENSVYDTDEMKQIIRFIEGLTETLREDKKKVEYDPTNKHTAPSFRVLTDHTRATTFALSDGIYPDNTGRGYVIRRIIRRGLLFAQEIGIKQPIMYRLVPEMVRIFGPFYPALKERAGEIELVIRKEEERFLRTLEQGLARFKEYMAAFQAAKSPVFGGAEAFRLYDTYGFPLEMTVELAEKQGLTTDMKGFEACMQEQRDRAHAHTAFKDWSFPADFKSPGESSFTGYERMQDSAKVQAILILRTKGESTDAESVPSVEAKGGPSQAILVFDHTPFYPEGGGQLGDTGQITSGQNVFTVLDTKKKQGLILHIGEITHGKVSVGDSVELHVDSERRENLTHHHSATHLLNKSLRDTLGHHVSQTGSLVSPDYLRFDFSHGEKIPADILRKVEEHVNAAIAKKAAVDARIMPIDQAKTAGAVATFGEKYGTEVRVISMGEDGKLSRELCGGCHVPNTGNIQYFHIVKESSPGAGNRRIEAVAGSAAARFFEETIAKVTKAISAHNDQVHASNLSADEKKAFLIEQKATTEEKSRLLGMGAAGVSPLTSLLEQDAVALEKAAREYSKLSRKTQGGATLSAEEVELEKLGDLEFCARTFEGVSPESVKQLGDSLKEKHRKFCGLFGLKTDKGPVLIFMANRGAVEAGVDCGKLIREASGLIGGGGGGKPEMAQAGGKDASGLESAVQRAKGLLKESLHS